MPPNGVRNGEHVREVGRPVLVRGRSDRDEHDVARRDRSRDVRRESQPLVGLVALDEPVEPGLVDRQPVLLQPVDLCRVDVRSDDLVPRLSEAGTDHQPHIPGPDDADVQAPRTRLRPPRRAASVTTCAFVRTKRLVTLRLSTINDALSITSW